jgi:hypothetical protein
MTTLDSIARERQLYLASARTRQDWMRYLAAVERLRQQREGYESRSGS